MIFVIAGTYEQARHEMEHERGKAPGEWRYISEPQALAGVHGAEIVVCGTTWERPDYHAMMIAAKQAAK